MSSERKKKQLPGILRFLIKFGQILLYIPIQIVFIPIAIIGLVDAIIKEFRNTKKLGVSFTAVQALQYRWMMHYFETREDSLSVKFIKKFPCESHFGLLATFGPLIISQKLFGFTTKFGKIDEPGKEGYNSIVARRLLMFDDIMKKYIDEVDQVVMPGSGFDLLAQRYTKNRRARIFELDQADTINLKVDTLEKADIEHDWITYIPVDYSKESWSEKLMEEGFDTTKKTLFIWQSVSLYLDAEAVEDTLGKMAGICAEGSIIAQDLYSEAFVSGKSSKTAKKTADMFGNRGEIWKFGVDMSENPEEAVESFLKDCGLRMTDFHIYGDKLKAKPYYCIVEAKNI